MKGQRPKETELGLAAVYLEQAMREPGCPICRQVREAEERWIWNALYEFTGDPELHERFASALGLCREHAALMAQVVETRELLTPAAVARLYETVVIRALEELANFRGRRNFVRKNCPVRQLARDTEDRETWFLGRLLEDEDLWRAYEGSDGLCLPHLLKVLPEAHEEVWQKLVSDFRRRLTRLLQNLRELQRKERFDVDEPLTPEEIESWREALWRLGGMSYSAPLIKRG